MNKSYAELVAQDITQRLASLNANKPGNVRRTIRDYLFDCAEARIIATRTATNPALDTGMQGYQLMFCRKGSNPGAAFDIEFDSSDEVLKGIRPGAKFTLPFQRCTIRSVGATNGPALFKVIGSPGIDYNEDAGTDSPLIAPVIAEFTAPYNAVAWANPPTLATQGLPIYGLRAVRALLVSAGGAILTAPTIRWWVYSDTPATSFGGIAQAGWYATNNVDPMFIPGAAVLRISSADWEVGVQAARAFPEVIGWTNAGGSAPGVVIQGS